MDINLIVSIVGQIATWLTIILVYFTLIEMRNQRKALQKPDVILPEATIYGYAYGYEGKDTLLIASTWSDEKGLEDLESFSSQAGLIKLYNVGFGVAKNIVVKWTVDYNETVEQIRDYCYKNSVPLIVQLNKNNLSVIDGVGYSPDDYSILDSAFNHDFLMPVSIVSQGLEVSVPFALVELISIAVYLKAHYTGHHLNENSELKVDLPPIALELSYDDLDNSRYSKRFDVIFSISSYSTLADEKTVRGFVQQFYGVFRFKIKP